MNSKLKPHSEALNLLRFPLALVVVLVHVVGAGIPNRESYMAASPLFAEVLNFIKAFLSGQSVPIYFFISGYVFFLGITLTSEKYKQKLKNRVKTLLIPYFIWNLLMLLEYVILRMPVFSRISPSIQQMDLNLTLSGFLNCFWDATSCIFPADDLLNNPYIYPINVPLWFLRDLMIVVLTTPVIYYLLKKIGFNLIVIFGIIKFLVLPYLNIDGQINQLMIAYFYFSWGAYMSVYNKNMLVEFGRFSKPSVVLYVVLGIAYMLSSHYYPAATSIIKTLNVIVGLFFAYNFAAWLLRHHVCKPNEFLSSASFFIYVSHRIVWIPILKVLVFLIKPSSGLDGLLVYFLTWSITIVLLCMAFWLMRKYTPNLLRVIAGRK